MDQTNPAMIIHCMNKNNTQSEDSDDIDDTKLRQLAKAITISPAAMFEISSSAQLIRKKIQQYNDLAVLKMEGDQLNEALIYLEQAEKVIEYVDTRGRKIDRCLKLCVMQNQVCAYQRLWQLDHAHNYMEAIIVNMQQQMEKSSSVEIQELYFSDSLNEKDSLKLSIARLSLMAISYLQFSAIGSQLKRNMLALRSVKQALKTLKLVCEQCIKLEMHSSKPVYESLSRSMLAELATIPDEVELDKASSYLMEAKKNLAKLKKSSTRRKNMTDKVAITFRVFAIGDVMQVNPITLAEMESRVSLKEQITTIGRLYKAIYISICFFAMATENRLIADSKHPLEAAKKISSEFKMSELYHLKAIQIAAKYIPCETKYLDHILTSFKKHYDIDLLEESGQELVQQTSSIGIDSRRVPSSEHKTAFHQETSSSTMRKNLHKHIVFTESNLCKSKQEPMIDSKSKQNRDSVTKVINTKSDLKTRSPEQELKFNHPTIHTLQTIRTTIQDFHAHASSSSKNIRCLVSSKDYASGRKRKVQEKSKNKKKTRPRETGEDLSKSKSKSQSKQKIGNPVKQTLGSKSKTKKKGARARNQYFMEPGEKKKKQQQKKSKSGSKKIGESLTGISTKHSLK